MKRNLLSIFIAFYCVIIPTAQAEFSAPCPFSSRPDSLQPLTKRIVVTILGARVKAAIDSDILFFVDRADVYGKIKVQDQQFDLPEIKGSDSPNWVTDNRFEAVVNSGHEATVQIFLADRDGDFSGDDDVIDINPSPLKKELDLIVDLCSLRVRTPEMPVGASLPLQRTLTFAGDNPYDDEYGQVDFRIEMADGRPIADDDLSLTELDTVQSVHNSPLLAAGKPFVVMARVANSINAVVDTTIEISMSGAGLYRTDTFPIAGLQPGEVRRQYFYTDTPLIPSTSGSFDYLHLSARIDPAGKFSGQFSGDDCRVRNDYIGLEPQEGLAIGVLRTSSPYIHYIRMQPFIGPTAHADATRFTNLADSSAQLIQAAYPVPSVGHYVDYDVWTPAVSGAILDTVLGLLQAVGIPGPALTPFLMMFEMNTRAALGGVSKYVGVMHYNYFPSIIYGIWANTPGVSLGTVGSRAVLVAEGINGPAIRSVPSGVQSSMTLPMHEFSHTYGLSVEPSIKDSFFCGVDDPLGIGDLACGILGGFDEYTHSNPDFHDGMPATGYWVKRAGEHSFISPLSDHEMCETHGIMGTSPRGDYLDWAARPRWMDRQNYIALIAKLFAFGPSPERLADKIDPNKPDKPSSDYYDYSPVPDFESQDKKPTDSILISGIINFNDKGVFFPFWRLGVTKPDRDGASSDGLYAARFFDKSDKIKPVLEVGIPLDPSTAEQTPNTGVPLTMFSYSVPFPARTTRIDIVNRLTGKVLLSRPVSAKAPTVTLADAKQGFSVKSKDKLKLTWTGDDKDFASISDRVARAKKLRYSVLIRDKRTKVEDGWRVLAMNIQDRQYLIDTAELSGSTYQVKIMASDGVNSGTSQIAQLKIKGSKVPK